MGLLGNTCNNSEACPAAVFTRKYGQWAKYMDSKPLQFKKSSALMGGLERGTFGL
jgi:hypothetical protein